MPRQAGLDAPGTLHHVIIQGIERKKIVRARSKITSHFDAPIHPAWLRCSLVKPAIRPPRALPCGRLNP
jgi:hypothetical protein